MKKDDIVSTQVAFIVLIRVNIGYPIIKLIAIDIGLVKVVKFVLDIPPIVPLLKIFSFSYYFLVV